MQNVQYFVINSADRVAGSASSTDFKVRVNPCISHVNKVELLELTVPNSIYNVKSTNNVIYFKEPLSGGNDTATITPGAYTTTTITAAIAAAMNASTNNAYTYSVAFDSTTYKLTITSTGAFQLQFATFTTNSAGSLLGFTTDTTAGLSQVANQAIALFNPRNYYIDFKDFNSNVRSTNSVEYGTFIINSTVNSGGIESWSLLSRYPQSISLSNQTINTLSIAIKDVNNTVVDLNGLDWSIVVGISY